MKTILVSILALFASMTWAADLNGRYVVHNASCLPKYPDIVKPITMTIHADIVRVSYSVLMQSQFADVGIYDFPIDTMYIRDAASGHGVTYLHEVGKYTANGFSYFEQNDQGILRSTDFSLSSKGTLTIKRLLDDGFHGTCIATKIN